MKMEEELIKLIKNNDIKTNSKDINKGDIFVCALGNYDKNIYINDAIDKSCSFIVTNIDINDKVDYLKVDNPNLYLKKMLDEKYEYPLLNKTLIGVTGTDGKTTVVTIIRDMLNGASIGTNGLEFNEFNKNLCNTTPNLVELYECFDIINKNNIKVISMEVSSESYLTNRIPYLLFDIGIFLNISKEHLDKHKSFDNYLMCKKKLLLNSKIKIINRDDSHFTKIVKGLGNYLTFGKKKSDLQIINYHLYIDKTEITFKYQKKKYYVISPLLGEYNIFNLAAAIITLLGLGYDIEDVIKRIKNIKNPKGRMELLRVNNKLVMIDYAHTIKATERILNFLNKFYHKKIITVVGCAGGRYKEKRPLIGKSVLKFSKMVIFTSDDPRWDDPNDIISEMIGKSKNKNYYIEIDREKAIKKALDIVGKNEILLILGKGRDNYMAIYDEIINYSDIDVLKKYDNSVK